jgi:hypothetical protein
MNMVQNLRFQVLTTLNMKVTVFCDVALCSFTEIYWHSRDAYCADGGNKHL